MKSITYCDSIERMVLAKTINCDAFIISNERIQSILLDRSELNRILFDNSMMSMFRWLNREAIAIGIPLTIKRDLGINKKTLIYTLTAANTVVTCTELFLLLRQHGALKEKYKALDKSNYKKLYCTQTDTFLFLHNRLVNKKFDDAFQISVDSLKLCGLYMDFGDKYCVDIYDDHYTQQYRMTNKQPEHKIA